MATKHDYHHPEKIALVLSKTDSRDEEVQVGIDLSRAHLQEHQELLLEKAIRVAPAQHTWMITLATRNIMVKECVREEAARILRWELGSALYAVKKQWCDLFLRRHRNVLLD